MGSTEQYCLRWNDFQSNITGAFSDIRDDEDFLDVTLVSDGQTIRAHKLVLSACSPLFRSMLKKHTHPQPMIFLHGVRYPDIAAILNFMYHGEVNVNQEDLQTFLAAAEELRIRGLSDRSAMDSAASEPRSAESPSRQTQLPPPAKRARTVEQASNHSDANRLKHSSPSRTSSPATSTASLPGGGRHRLSMDEDQRTKKNMVITPDMPPADYHDNSSSQSASDQVFGEPGAAFPFDSPAANSMNLYHRGSRGMMVKEEGSPNGLAGDSPCLPPGHFSLHELGGRDAGDPMSRLRVARSPKGWHCPQCLHISTTKGNLKSHILSGRHKLFEKSYQCQFCSKHYSTRQSLQVHISTHHRQERDRDYKELSVTFSRSLFQQQMESTSPLQAGCGPGREEGAMTEMVDMVGGGSEESSSEASMIRYQQQQQPVQDDFSRRRRRLEEEEDEGDEGEFVVPGDEGLNMGRPGSMNMGGRGDHLEMGLRGTPVEEEEEIVDGFRQAEQQMGFGNQQ